MSEVKNPFSEETTHAKPSGSKVAWIIAVLMAIASIVTLLLWVSTLNRIRALEPLRGNLADTTASLSNALATVQSNKDQIAALQSQLAALQKEKEAAGQAAKKLEDEMRSDLESKDVTISKLQGKLTVNIVDRVMFGSGDAVLNPEGETVLRKIAAILAEHPDVKVHVIGHTDNVPIHTRFASNWELSTARALAAVHFLTEKAGVAPSRVGAVGYGEFRPIADNSTAEGRSKNRRIAITILSDELAGADVQPIAQTNDPAAQADATSKTGMESK